MEINNDEKVFEESLPLLGLCSTGEQSIRVKITCTNIHIKRACSYSEPGIISTGTDKES